MAIWLVWLQIGVVVDGTTQTFDPAASSASYAIINAGGQVITAAPRSNHVIITTILSAGGAAVIFLYGQTITITSGGVVVNGITLAFIAGAASATDPVLVSVMSDGVSISDATSGIVVGGHTMPFSTFPTGGLGHSTGVITVSTDTYSAFAASQIGGDVVIEHGSTTMTLSAGGRVFTVMERLSALAKAAWSWFLAQRRLPHSSIGPLDQLQVPLLAL